ncbi:WD_REPEATS_REGION domain-containing protein [Trichonephila clavipes]|uniref:WD_REPEATS_REGION domain-containing protein n=1 Tax=Trichonephila clavipes TaxID=2585209 RepID=A0A8X6VBJ3_TRICX|nr:WD_REPEATS_REGION domain-containing protein [Trichonephila clavipes]
MRAKAYCAYLSFRNLRRWGAYAVNNAEKKTSATSFSSFLKQNSFLLGERDHDKNFKSLFVSFLKGNGMSFDGIEIDFGKFYNFEDSFYECSYPFVKELQHGSNSFTTVISSQPTSSKAEENTKKGSAPILQAQYSDISSPSSLGSSQHEFKSSEANQTEQKRAEIDFGKFHNFKDSFYECSYPFVKELQHGSNSFTTVISSQPTSSKAEENTKKGSAPILQAQYSDISSPSSPGSSQHEFNSSEANQTEQETTKILEEMSLPEIKDYFSKDCSKLKEWHLLTVNNEDIVSASDVTDLYVVCGFQSSLIRVWNISSEWWINGMKFDEHCILRGHKGTVNSVEINSELQRLISGSCDKTVRIWDLEMRTCLSEHVWHSKAVYGVCWSPTSKCFLSSSADGTAVLHWYNEIKPTTVYTHNSKTDVPIFV